MAERGVNKVILIGNVGQDPETVFLTSGSQVTNISLATSESWNDKQTGEKKEKTEWHKVTFFGKLAEIASEYLRKGSKVYIEGKLQTDKWQDNNGQDRYTTKIMSHKMQMLDSRSSAQEQQPANSTQPPAPSQQHQQGSGPQPEFDDKFDDDIPF